MNGDPGRTTPTRSAPWWSVSMRECRLMLFTASFDDALELAQRSARRARTDGDERLWRRFMNQQALALSGACRFDEALRLCDEVIGATAEHEDPGAVAHAWNISVAAAQRLSRDDTLRRLDEAFALGEWFLREHGRMDSLGRAAATAASVGLAELGDTIFTRVIADIDAGAAGRLAPSSLLWIKSQGITVRMWWALALDHDGDPGAVAAFEGAVGLTRSVLSDLPGAPALFGLVAAVLHGFESLALTALGRLDEARRPLAEASALLPSTSSDVFTAAVELSCGFCSLRTGSVTGREAAELVARLVATAQRSGDVRAEAEAWRLGARAAAAAGDRAGAAIARNRFEALVERLDWRRRLQSAELLTFRSQTLQRIVAGEEWGPAQRLPDPPG